MDISTSQITRHYSIYVYNYTLLNCKRELIAFSLYFRCVGVLTLPQLRSSTVFYLTSAKRAVLVHTLDPVYHFDRCKRAKRVNVTNVYFVGFSWQIGINQRMIPFNGVLEKKYNYTETFEKWCNNNHIQIILRWKE